MQEARFHGCIAAWHGVMKEARRAEAKSRAEQHRTARQPHRLPKPCGLMFVNVTAWTFNSKPEQAAHRSANTKSCKTKPYLRITHSHYYMGKTDTLLLKAPLDGAERTTGRPAPSPENARTHLRTKSCWALRRDQNRTAILQLF